MRWLVTLLLLMYLGCGVQSSSILAIFPFPSKSHVILGSALLKGLLEHGHEVTMISYFPQNPPIANYTDIALEFTDFHKEFLSNAFKQEHKPSILEMFQKTRKVLVGISADVLKNPDVQKLLHSNVTFDVVIAQHFLSEAMMGFAEHFNCSLVLFANSASTEISSDIMGNTSPYSYVQSPFLTFSGPMTFFQRVLNTLVMTTCQAFKYVFHFPTQNFILQTEFNTNKTIWDIVNEKAPLMLLNTHPSITQPIPHVPGMIEIGGIQTAKPKPLPKHLQEFLDEAKEGVIYLSMGSNVQSSQLPLTKRDAILNVFSKLPQQVMWKWEENDLPGQPSNLRIEKWFPQQDILAHPNVKAFITHGGFGSVTESLYHGVPMVVIPFGADQNMNAANAVANGYGIKIEYDELTEETLMAALKEVLFNRSYQENVRSKSALLKDRPLHPLDEAVFWVEHVIRHGGAHHLKVASLDLRWYQYFLVDVVAFLVILISISIILLYTIIKVLCKRKRNINSKVKKN